jgi:cell wall assembly regulator SMI1
MSVTGVLEVTGLSSRQPAKPSEIDAAERELGVRFPDDYRAFLQQSDGISCSGP